MAGTLTDTYVAALQHGTADVPREARLVGVVRKPPPWFYASVDENRRELGPPEGLLTEVKQRHNALEDEGMSDAAAHNRAMDEVEYEKRYRDYLDTSPEADSAFNEILETIRDGDDVALVCFENTEEKRCHRTILRDRLRAELA